MKSTEKPVVHGEFVPIFLKLPPCHIVTLKFILESYEGLGIIRTLNSATGEVVVLALKDTSPTVHQVLSTLEEELQLRTIPPPESLADDWLLQEELEVNPRLAAAKADR